MPMDEFATQHDPLTARVVLFEDGSHKAALASIDLTSIGAPLAARWANQIAEIARCPASNVLISAGHSFSTPHVFAPGTAPHDMAPSDNAALLAVIETALTTATRRAANHMVPVRMAYAQGTSHIAVNRDQQTTAGWWLGINEAGYTDPTLSVLRFDDMEGKTVAILINYAVQPSILSGLTDARGKKIMSADLTATVARQMEAQYGPTSTAFFLPGAGGDQAPRPLNGLTDQPSDAKTTQEATNQKSIAWLSQLSGQLAGDAMQLIRQAKAKDIPALTITHDSVALTGLVRNRPNSPVHNWTYQPSGPVKLPYDVLRIGDVALVTTAPELSAALGARIRQGSPFGITMVVTMVGNASKYLPDQQGFDRFSYEALSSPYAPGSGETFADAVVQRLNAMSHQK